MVREVGRTLRGQRLRRLRRRHRHRRHRHGYVTFTCRRVDIPTTRTPRAKPLHGTIFKVDPDAILDVYLWYTILRATGYEPPRLEYVLLGNAVLAGLGAVISQHVLVDGLRSREGRTHLFAQRAHHCGLAPYEGVWGGMLAGVVALGLGGTAVARTMAYAAGYPNLVPALIAPRGRGRGKYDTGY